MFSNTTPSQTTVPSDEELMDLLSKRKYLAEYVQMLNRQVLCKKNADEKGEEAHYYSNNWVMGYSVLDEPLSVYVNTLAKNQAALQLMDDQIKAHQELKEKNSHEEVSNKVSLRK
jgi:hypothetical protein